MGHLTGLNYKFRTGAVRQADLRYALAMDGNISNSDLPHTVFYQRYEDDWEVFDISEWDACSICVTKYPKEQSVSLGEKGDVRVIGSGDDFEETISDSGRKLTLFREVRAIEGYAYACGMDRQVYRREGPGQWSRMDGDMASQPAVDIVFGFESIHGFSHSDIYAVGWHGEIWRFDGKVWSQISSPTNLILTRVLCAGDGNVYICGMKGMLLRGREDKWEVIDHQVTDSDFWDLEWFQGKLYISSLHAIYCLNGDALEVADVGDDPPSTCYHLDSADGIMWSIGASDILEFDGTTWTRIE